MEKGLRGSDHNPQVVDLSGMCVDMGRRTVHVKGRIRCPTRAEAEAGGVAGAKVKKFQEELSKDMGGWKGIKDCVEDIG
ncbi:hypothetical protein PAPYR_8115 [Paratrimastix pyriformis]|uniref:Uncharacterized protein n=1 Tax=Paratrimastix pyriformis TaxID=342808 RepID=A0ABQ8UEU5_9EUKA|nr:hypothetical protein PAPYR_8115 [Paratrimastix pyriformis]